jgi:glycolate oxidase iron-sulfur subunit
MILVDEGRLRLADSFVRHIDLCLDCRACETACPSGVELLPYPGRLALLGGLLRFYQRPSLQSLVRRSGLLRLFGKLGRAEAMLPPVDDNLFFSQLGRVFPAAGERRARVALFAGCIAQIAFSELNRATIRVLQKNGCEVVVPSGQLCCGALHVHAGDRDAARELASANLDAFLSEDFDAIIINAAGCGSTLKEYELLFHDDEAGRARARQFTEKVRDVTEFLTGLGLRPPQEQMVLRVTYQDSCHLAHGQKITEAPRELLRGIPGVELVEMRLADHCCGSAGVYNVTQPEMAGALLEEKMQHARATGASVIATANPGCILQLRHGAVLYNTGQEVLHVIELLDRSYTKT